MIFKENSIVRIKPKDDRFSWCNEDITNYMRKNNLESINVLVNYVLYEGKFDVVVFDDCNIKCKIYMTNWDMEFVESSYLPKDLFEL